MPNKIKDPAARIIRGAAFYAGLETELAISQKSGIPNSTLHERLQMPTRITLAELRQLIKATEMPDDRVLEILHFAG